MPREDLEKMVLLPGDGEEYGLYMGYIWINYGLTMVIWIIYGLAH